MKALRAEIDAMETTDKQGRQLKTLGDKPLVILSTEWVQGEPNEMLKKLVQVNRDIYARMAKDSTRGVLRPLASPFRFTKPNKTRRST
ncbi:hypothetical protein ACN28S_12245 [Cystobacter fuscus]